MLTWRTAQLLCDVERVKPQPPPSLLLGLEPVQSCLGVARVMSNYGYKKKSVPVIFEPPFSSTGSSKGGGGGGSNTGSSSSGSDCLCGLVVRVSGYRYRGLGFDSRRYQIFLVLGLERGPLSLVRSIEELLE